MRYLPPFWFFRAIRDREITDISFREFLDSIGQLEFDGFLHGLVALGAIRFDESGRKIEVLDWTKEFMSTFGLSLTDLSDYMAHSSVITNPVFGKPSKDEGAYDLFVLMPFDPTLKPVYDDHIKAVAEKQALTIARADDFFTADAIMRDVWRAINNAKLIIADCTGKNPNVFYEIGIAHTLGKSVILLAQDIEDIPFDLRHFRSILYDYTPRGMTQFEDRLSKTIEFELENHKGLFISDLDRRLKKYKDKIRQ
jgi:hypothetical protein